MNINNFDQASTGTNIELTAFLDGDLARSYYMDTFTEFKAPWWESFLFYSDCGQNETPASVTDCFSLAGVTEKAARRFLFESLGGTARRLIEEKQNYYSRWEDFLEDTLTEDYDLFECARGGFPTIPGAVLLYDAMTVRGYSQGDRALILYKITEAPAPSKQALQRIVYDAPAYVLLTVDGEEYQLSEDLPDIYEYDLDTIIEAARLRAGDVAAAFCRKHLPEYLVYVGL